MNNNYRRRLSNYLVLCVVALSAISCDSARAEAPYKDAWTRQLETTGSDQARGVSADGLGNVYISGSTGGELAAPNLAGLDAFVSKFDADGALLWTRQLGASAPTGSNGVSADRLGNVFISGFTRGVSAELSTDFENCSDAFVSKFDARGKLLWTRQLGTPEEDQSMGVSADGGGNVYISGFTKGPLGGPNAGGADAFVSKYDADGNLLWTRQWGTSAADGSTTCRPTDGIVHGWNVLAETIPTPSALVHHNRYHYRR